ncbi:MAG: hypothetical protein QW222_01345 [Candidatus Bathyarchaeia archaeon]
MPKILISSIPLSAGSMAYDFIEQASNASWRSGSGALPFPGSPDDSRGFARYVYNATLEDGSLWKRVLETHPQWVNDGYILGRYPKQTIPENVQLRVKIGFLYGATGTDGATFQVLFMDEKENMYSILSYKVTYDSQLNLIVKDLAFLTGKTGYFILRVDAGKSSGQDWAVWAEARIETTALPDQNPPKVTIVHSPGSVDDKSIVTFTAFATDDTEVTRIVIYVNESVVKECISPEFNKEKNEWVCQYIGGPYPTGTLTYRAEAFDSAQNKGVSETTKLTIVKSPIPEESRKGWLRVTTAPVQGVIYLDGTYRGLAPLQIELDAGIYTVSFGDVEGYIKPEPQTVMVSAGRVTDVTGTYIRIIIPPTPGVPRLCTISGKIYAFPYNINTLKVKICEAERICYRPHPLAPETCTYSCKRDGRVWYADVSVHMYGMAGARTYEYTTVVACNGTYMVEPVYQPYENECEWRGRWIPSNAIFVDMNGTSKEVDFTFEPFDQSPPEVRIEFRPDKPRIGGEVEVRVLAEDDKGIRSIFVKIDRGYSDGSSIEGNWRRLDFTQSFDRGIYEAIATERFSEESVTVIVVNAWACDEGGNRRLASPQVLEFECAWWRITFDFWGGGRVMRSSTSIFGYPDRDQDGINDCWEEAAMRTVNPYIELDEGEKLKEYPTILVDHVVNFVRVTPYPSKEDPRYILFYYIVTWSRDYGRFDVEAHPGDTEPLIMAWRVMDPYTVNLQYVYIGAHGGCNKRQDLWNASGVSCNMNPFCNAVGCGDCIAGNQMICSQLQFIDNRLYLYASEDKHALYPSCGACERTILIEPQLTGLSADACLCGSEESFGQCAKDFGLCFLNLVLSGIRFLWDAIVAWFTMWEDDYLGAAQVAFDYVYLRERGWNNVLEQTLNIEGDTDGTCFCSAGCSFHYWVTYRIETRTSAPYSLDRPHVRITLTQFCTDNLSCDHGSHDEPYFIVTGFSIYPEGVTTWRAAEHIINSMGHGCITISDVVFDGEITPDYIIGFTVNLWDYDEHGDKSRSDVESSAETIKDELYSYLAGEKEPGGCREYYYRLAVGEDCGGYKPVTAFPAYNVGEPCPNLPAGESCPTLWINDLGGTSLEPKDRFYNEYVQGRDCGCKDSEGRPQYKFCGGYDCSCNCGTSILHWMQFLPDKLRDLLGH